MRMGYFWILIICFFIILTGTLGFKTEADCVGKQGIEKAKCHHQAAISYAVVGQATCLFGHDNCAVEQCNEIRLVDDLSTANAQANSCFGDIAVLFKDKEMCNNIEEDPAAVIFTGADVTRNTCEKKINNINNARNYQCPLFYIFPLTLVLAICFRPRHP